MSQNPEARGEEGAGLHDRGLLLIGLFKLSKSLFFFCVGLGALHLLHKDLGDEVMRLAQVLHRDPEGRLITLLMEKTNVVSVQRLREVGFFAFAYSGLALIEGYGLTMERVWAEYLTLSLTVVFLPWEIYELARHATVVKLGLLITNLLVLGYLLWLLQRKKQKAARPAVPAY